MKNIIFLFLALFLCSCARKIQVDYSHAPENNSTLIIQPSKPVDRTFLTINDQLLVKKKYVKEITVNGLPAGDIDYHLISESWYYKEPFDHKKTITLKPNQTKTELYTTPPYSNGYYAFILGITALDILVLALLL